MKTSTSFVICFMLLQSLLPTKAYMQTISCSDLVNAVEAEASYYDQVTSISLLTSEFLEEVKAYQYEDILFVIAKFKREPGEIFSKKYIFCGVPTSNWRSFKYGIGDSYGKRFHQYIMDHVCNCY
ncbi:MAG: hypothetical protein R3D58_14795 [Saprospiraceae bacterium]